MSYEEKYKEALKRADSLTEKYGGREFAEYVFPELAESEDERIRKWLVDYFKEVGRSWIHREISPEQVLAWLEKQKEPADGDFARGYDCGYECCLHSHGAEWFEKQKEQKPAERSEDAEQTARDYERENRQSVLSSVDIVNAFIEGARWEEGRR